MHIWLSGTALPQWGGGHPLATPRPLGTYGASIEPPRECLATTGLLSNSPVFSVLYSIASHYQLLTRKLCYSKDDRAMRAI